MVWEKDAPNAGFSTGRPWLPVPDSQRARAVDVQAPDVNSVLTHYRAVLGIRHAHPALACGSIRFLEAEGNLLAFIREWQDEKLLCVFNFGDSTLDWPMPCDLGPVEAVDFAGYGAPQRQGVISLAGLRAFIGQLG
jgi:alpha-glucosidase